MLRGVSDLIVLCEAGCEDGCEKASQFLSALIDSEAAITLLGSLLRLDTLGSSGSSLSSDMMFDVLFGCDGWAGCVEGCGGASIGAGTELGRTGSSLVDVCSTEADVVGDCVTNVRP